MALPIDLQVLISKAPEHQDNLARQINAQQSGMVEGIEKQRVQSIEANDTVNSTEQYEGTFTKINPDAENRDNKEQMKKRNRADRKGLRKLQKPELKPALKEEGTGNIIDIVE